MAREKLGSNAQFVAPNKGLSVIGDHVYAFSGSVGVTGTSAYTTLLAFSTAAKGYIIAKVALGSKAGHGDDMSFRYSINGNIIYTGYEALVSMPTQQYLNILFPPASNVEIEARNDGSSTERLVECVIVGRIYE